MRGTETGSLSTIEENTGNIDVEYTDSTVTAETTYYYAVLALSQDGDGAQSTTVSATTPAEAQPVPSAPTGLTTYQVAHDSVTISWTPPSQGSVTGYRILRGTDSDSLSAIVQNTDSTATEYTDSTVTAATTYYYAVLALSVEGDGAQSAAVSATTPAAPQQTTVPDLRLSSTTAGQLTISWDAPNPSPSDYRIVWAKQDLDFPSYSAANEANRGNEYPSGDETSITITGLSGGSTFKVKARSRYTSGGDNNGPWSGPWTDTVTARVKDDLPTAPTGLTVSQVAHDSVTLSWTAPSSGSTVAGYRVLRGADADSLSTITQDTGNTTVEYTDSTVAAETTYHYAVLALSQDGDGAQSATTSATTPAAPQPVPTTPTGLIATPSHDQVSLSWDDPQNGNITGYQIWRGPDATRLASINADTGSTTTTTYVDDTVTAETAYHYAVNAINSTGTGDQSTTVSTTTTAAPQEKESKDPPKGTPVPDRVTRAAPILRSAIVSNTGARIRIRFTEEVDRTNVPPASAFTVTADGIALTVSSITSSSTFVDRFFIHVTPLIQANQVVVVTYTDPTTGDDTNAIQDTDGNDAPSFTTGSGGSPAVSNISSIADTKGPAFASAAADGTSLIITFYENPAAAASLANSAFTVKKTPSGATEATIVTLSATVGPVISGKTVTLTLATELAATDSVTVTYTKPTTGTANKLVDAATNETGTFTDQTVINNTVDLTVTSIVRQSPTSSPTKVDTLTWRVTFNEEAQNVDAADFSVDGTTATLAVSAVSGVTGAYDVTATGGDLPSLDATVTLSIAATHNIQDTLSKALTNTTPTGTNDKTYVVDNTPPTLIGSAVFSTGAPIELRFSEDMDQTNLPPASSVTVTADGIALTVSEIAGVPGDIQYQRRLIWLRHLPVIRMGQVVVVTYTDPTSGDDVNTIQDLAGNDVPSFTTEIFNSSPIFSVAPDAPTDLSATANGATAITLAWTAPADNGGGIISGYKVEVSTDSGTTWTVQVSHHRQHSHHLRAHRPHHWHHASLPRVSHQLEGHQLRLQHRQCHHRHPHPQPGHRGTRHYGTERITSEGRIDRQQGNHCRHERAPRGIGVHLAVGTS